jgi:methylthioribose-1-phosphate isomerase
MIPAMSAVRPIEWKDGVLRLLDQRILPTREEWIECRDAAETAFAITDMVVRGAPAIGVTAGFGMALSARIHAGGGGTGADLASRMEADRRTLRDARPTAVNLAWAVDRLWSSLQEHATDAADEAASAIEREAAAMLDEDIAANRALGAAGAEALPQEATVLTHCNAGALATAGYGTALGVVRAAVEAGKKVAVVADETRPFLQGARLTAWELQKDGIPVTLIADVAAATLLRNGDIDVVVVGADRIAANGDVVNKVGTYPVAVLAREHGVPFYVAAPTSTVDLELSEGSLIPIEERPADEVLTCFGKPIAPEGISVRNPAFDMTPHGLVAGIATEEGLCRAPYTESLKAAVSSARAKRGA